MRKFLLVASIATLTSFLILASDWPMQSGNPERNGWAKSEHLITKSNVTALGLLYKYRVDNRSRGLESLTSPIVDGNLITYRGFKEMLIFGASSDKVFSVDADLNKPLWETSLAYHADKPQSQTSTAVCPGGLTAPVMMEGSSSSSLHFAALASRLPAAPGARLTRPSPYFPPLFQTLYPLRPTTLTQLAALYTVSSDGYLHVLNSSTGENLLTPFKFVPPNAKVTSLNIWRNVVYATTADHCDGYQNAVFAIDLLSSEKKVVSFVPQGGGFTGVDGTAIGNDGTVYVQTMYRPGDAPGDLHDTILALTPKDLRVKDYFSPSGKSPGKQAFASPGITPMVVSGKGRDLVVAGGRDGRVYLLDSRSLGGADHKTPLFASEPVAAREKAYDGSGLRGSFSSWHDVDTQTRWIYAPLVGRPNSSAKLPAVDGTPATGGIVAFKMDGELEKPTLEPLWISRDIESPAPVVIANEMIFALSTGLTSRAAHKDGKAYTIAEAEALASHATLYVLDALTGKELYSTGNTVTGYSHSGGLAVANGRVYFSTHDDSVYCFGFLKGQPQLTEQ